MAFRRKNPGTFVHIEAESILHFISEVDNNLFASFAVNMNSGILEVHIIQIQADTLGNTNSGTEKKSNQRQIANLRFLVKFLLTLCQLFSGLHLIQQNRNLINIQSNNFFLVLLWKKYKSRRIRLDHFLAEEIVIKCLE